MSREVREPLTDRQVKFMEMVERHLREAKQKKINGELSFRALIRDGGIMDAYKESKERES